MFGKVKYACSLLVICLISIQVFSQSQTTNYGKEFWVGFMENSSTPLALNLHFAAETPANITVSIPVLGNVSFFLGAKKDTVLSIPPAFVYVTGSESPQNRGVSVRADTAVSVIAFNNSPFSTDAVSLVPLEYLPKGGRYIINTFRGSNPFPSEFMVLATENNTSVEIIPSRNTRLGKPAGVPFTVMLQQGQVYQVQSADSFSMAGTRVRVENGCKKLVVFSGARCSQVNYNVGCSGCDHLWTQELPTNFWGTSYHTVPLKDMNNGYVLSFVASEDNTSVSIDGIPSFVLNAGQHITGNYNTNSVRCILADKPISVMQLIKSGECNGHPQQLSDPSMFRLIAEGQEIRKTFFRVPLTTNISSAFMSIVCSDPSLVFLNGTPVSTLSGISVADVCATVRKVITIPVLSQQYYQLESEDPFTAYMYGYGNAESYTLSMGSAYENLELNFTLNPSEFSYCDVSRQFHFTALNKKHTNLKWDFGDGTTATGNTSTHTFNQPGRFEVKLIGTKPDNDCPEDTVRKFITLFEPPFLELGNDTLICRLHEYLVVPENTDPAYQFRWHNGSAAQNFLVTQDQTVTLTVTDENGCETTDSLRVTFDECLVKKVEIPNVFTPGRDGYNDFFQITLDVYTQAECIVYNRWGVELYRYNPKVDLPWNGGVFNDPSLPCPDGTYYFLLYFTDPDTGERYLESGVVTLIREK